MRVPKVSPCHFRHLHKALARPISRLQHSRLELIPAGLASRIAAKKSENRTPSTREGRDGGDHGKHFTRGEPPPLRLQAAALQRRLDLVPQMVELSTLMMASVAF